jgi:hypothetical protein
LGGPEYFEQAPAKGSPAFFAKYFTGSAAEGKGYFRPGTPHAESRANAANQVLNLFQPAQAPAAPPPQAPKPAAPAAAASRPGWLDQLKIPSLGTLF